MKSCLGSVCGSLKMPLTIFSTLLAVLVLVGAAGSAAANNPGPVKDHAWGTCQLPASLRTTLNNAIKAASGNKYSSVNADFIVVHSIALDNNGQPLASGGNSGVVLCTFTGKSAATTTLETTPIPDAAGPHPGSTNINILANQQQSVLQYKLNDGSRAGKIEKRVCQTTDGNTDCVRVVTKP